jgi:MoaE-MoaD fusion protein
MQVRVLFFGVLKDLAGRSSDVLSLPDHATAADVLSHYAQRLSKSQQILNSIAISVNQEYARPEDRLRSGDEVALLPPVSGGAMTLESNSANAFITREKIDGAGALDLVKRPEDGAAVLFEGVVRNHSRGRRTVFLEYEAYEEMALKQLELLIVQARKDFQIRDAIIIHRLGRLEIGETSVLIVVASAHRAPAFDACRWLIDTLKRTVPIWKKEHFEDGAVWSDGEPFPEDRSTNVPRRQPALSEVERTPPVEKAVRGRDRQSTANKKAAVTRPEKLASNPIARK